jgi:hypothetical protein
LIGGGENSIKSIGFVGEIRTVIPALDSTKISGRKLLVVLHFTVESIVVEDVRLCFQVNYANWNILKTVKKRVVLHLL